MSKRNGPATRFFQHSAVLTLCAVLAACSGGASNVMAPRAQVASVAPTATEHLMHSRAAVTSSLRSGISTSQSNGVVYLQSVSGGHTARIGLKTGWGGSIVEVSLDGVNFVNAYDDGREVQPAMYDGAAPYSNYACSPCTTNTWGWNPVLGGDKYGHGSPVMSQTVTSSSLYVKTQPVQWSPDYAGGGPSLAVPSDMYMEQTVSVVPGSPLAFKVHVKMTHFGTDTHYNTNQEFPAVYVNGAYGTLSYYAGNAPWTQAATTSLTTVPAGPGTGLLFSAENWASYTNSANTGLTVFVPAQYPLFMASAVPGTGAGSTGFVSNYMHPFAPMTFGPGAVVESDIYLIPGNATTARSTVYALHSSTVTPDVLPPMGNVDLPQNNATVSGSFQIAGWAFDNAGVAGVQVLVDGNVVAQPAPNSVSRPDVAAAYANVAPEYSGWGTSYDSTKLANGAHSIVVRLTDMNNNVALLAPRTITVSN
jgi:Bacterial Ig domain